MEQGVLTPEALVAALHELSDPEKRRAMAARLAVAARPRAAQDIADLVRTMSGVRP
jgi:UDP-N-acetylglucosamine:LPS N-acetylglucosamine transferase